MHEGELKADKFRYAILLALSEQRQSGEKKKQVSSREVQEDVVALLRAVTSRAGGETAMIDIILLRNDAHLREVMRLHDHAYKSNFAKDVIKKSQNLVVRINLSILSNISKHINFLAGRNTRPRPQRRSESTNARRSSLTPSNPRISQQ